ncbi:Protein ENHANCED DISEASE RESISTANCE 2 [Orobanche minor]
MSKVMYEGWMVRYGRRKIGRSYIHMRYFVLEPRLLAYYKRKPQDNQRRIPPVYLELSFQESGKRTLVIGKLDGFVQIDLCRGRLVLLEHGHMVYVLSVYNKKEKSQRITMAAFNIQEALIWREKIEAVIDQHQDSQVPNGNKYMSFEYKSGMDNGRTGSSSDRESQFSAQEDEYESTSKLLRRTTMGNGPPESILDWTREVDSDLSIQNANNQAFSRKHWRLVQCLNGLRVFEELLEVDYLPRSCSRAMKAVGVVEATCEQIFELVMSMDGSRFEWDTSFQYGSLVEEVDGHTAIIYHRLQLQWFSMFVWPRDLCYVRYWRRNDDGSYVVLFRSREHENCGPQPGYVRAHVESGGFNISPLKSRNGIPRAQVQHLMQIDLKGWGVGYLPSFQQQCLQQMLNSVAGLREWFAQTDERGLPPRIPVMVNMASASVSSKRRLKQHDSSIDLVPTLDQLNAGSRHSVVDDLSDEDDEFQIAEEDQEVLQPRWKMTKRKLKKNLWIKLICHAFLVTFVVMSEIMPETAGGFLMETTSEFVARSSVWTRKHLMDLVAVDWFKDTKRMDHVARRQGCAAQVASEKGMVFYFVTKKLVAGSLLQRFVDGDDEFRNSRLKLIPSVPKGSWIVRQSVGSTPCLLGKAVDCNYIRDPNYLEVDVDIGSSTVANGVLGLVIGVITTLVVDMAFLVQANTVDELLERLIGVVRVSHIELKSAIVPKLEPDLE